MLAENLKVVGDQFQPSSKTTLNFGIPTVLIFQTSNWSNLTAHCYIFLRGFGGTVQWTLKLSYSDKILRTNQM